MTWLCYPQGTNSLFSPSIRIIPSSLQSSKPFHLGYADQLKLDEFSPRLNCLPRKRRILQQPCFHPSPQARESAFSHQYCSDTPQTRPLSQKIHVSTNPNDLFAPESPKALAPISAQEKSYASASLLRPCHICHRRPSTREHLEAYTDCDLCGQRACYICVRQCDAANCCCLGDQMKEGQTGDTLHSCQPGVNRAALHSGRTKKICSSCAVEGITETGMNVIRCLACVRQY
ncbi:hypothetical protein BJX61DRAFT_56253 [Aspergillus egyptiacus]|nr:hypothetical protein BJX61DRAFT_56253 [Aspergillus egyptiacus]